MALRFVRIGSLENIHVYDDAVFNGGVETDDVIKAGTAPTAGEDVLRLDDIGTLVGGIIGPVASTDNAIARWDGAGGDALQDSLVTIEDDGSIYTPEEINCNNKVKLTPLGGVAIRLTNKTGAASVAGKLVKADTATDDAVILTAANDVECFGVFLDDGVADGSEAWIVVAGIADVLLDDNVSAVRGNWMATGAAGYASTSVSPAAAPTHFEEIGHCIESVAATGAGTHILARCVLHFN